MDDVPLRRMKRERYNFLSVGINTSLRGNKPAQGIMRWEGGAGVEILCLVLGKGGCPSVCMLNIVTDVVHELLVHDSPQEFADYSVDDNWTPILWKI